jgi:hypothetical protein
MLGIEYRALFMLGKHSSIELNPSLTNILNQHLRISTFTAYFSLFFFAEFHVFSYFRPFLMLSRLLKLPLFALVFQVHVIYPPKLRSITMFFYEVQIVSPYFQSKSPHSLECGYKHAPMVEMAHICWSWLCNRHHALCIITYLGFTSSHHHITTSHGLHMGTTVVSMPQTKKPQTEQLNTLPEVSWHTEIEPGVQPRQSASLLPLPRLPADSVLLEHLLMFMPTV